MKLMWRLCCSMPESRRESGASRFWSLQTWLKGDCAIPVGGLEPAPFVDVGLPFSSVDDDGGELPAGDEDDPFPDNWPVISAGEARFETGPPGKVYDDPGEYTFGS